MSKSDRTRRRHQKSFKGQGKLTGYGFKAKQQSLPPSANGARKRSASVLSDPSTDAEVPTCMGPGLNASMHNVVGTVWGTGHIGKHVRVAVELSGTTHIEPGVEASAVKVTGDPVKVTGDPGHISIAVESSGTTHIEPRFEASVVKVTGDPVKVTGDPGHISIAVESSGTTHIEPRFEASVVKFTGNPVKVTGDPGHISVAAESSGTTHIEPGLDTGVQDAEPKLEDNDEEVEDWEAELEEHAEGPIGHIQDWADLRADVMKQLNNESKILPLSKLNQLMIISCFATLRLKGYSRTQSSIEVARQWHEGGGNWFARRVRALARHYQVFKRLPVERRGGAGNTRSWLHDESVKKSTLNWLTSQKTGKVTPQKLAHALNEALFPELNITPKSPISECTARRWLIKLGWRRTLVQKGVYMDGHEREDVVDYRKNVFLPAVTEFEKRMSRFEGPEMKRINPELEEGQPRIIALYHDECCFHANDDARNLW